MALVSWTACNRAPGGRSTEKDASVEVTGIRIEMEDYTNSSGEIESSTMESGEEVVVIPPDGWVTFEAPVAEAGRYRTTVRLSSGSSAKASCWIEDYIENKDGRQYNITGNMAYADGVTVDGFVSLTKDGSPLNKGTHPMKLHVAGGAASVDWISFELLKEHQITPKVLTQRTDGDEWVVVWSDEFEYEGLPDTTKWIHDIGNWGWGNNELQYYTEDRLENARVEGGNLVIEARKGEMGQKWTSARLTTRGKTSFIHGKIEFRASVPVERGNWSAGWTLGDVYRDELSWPYCGEIDIMESVGFEIDDETGDGKAHASIHCGAYYFKNNNQPTAITDVKQMQEDFHLYGIEWTADYIKAYVDDLFYFTYNDNADSLTWPFDEPQNIILNLAMGGGWGGAQGMDESVTSQKLLIDYVRVYELQ